jgi:ComF family protein
MGLKVNRRQAARQAALWARGLLAVLVPPLCVACGKRLDWDSRWLCRGCGIALALEARPLRRVIEIGGGEDLLVCYSFRYTPTISGIIAEMKYGDKPGLAGMLVPFLDFAAGGLADSGTGVVPVPIHASKRRERGYNQSRLLAEGLARVRGLDLDDILVKTRATVSQTNLERHRRLSNVMGSIGVKHSPRPLPAKALLVDDVVTTGSTLKACAYALEAAGIKEITACTLAASL